VTGEDTGPEVLWQQVGGGSVLQASQVGAPGDSAVLPPSFNVDEGEGLVITEVYFDFQPVLLASLIPARRLYYQPVYRPRRTAIVALQAE
jgi:hypothetical protein